MPLTAIVENLDGVDDSLKEEYVKIESGNDAGKFMLKCVTGLVENRDQALTEAKAAKNERNELKTQNSTLQEQVTKFQEAENKRAKDSGDTKTVMENLQAQITQLQETNKSLEGKLTAGKKEGVIAKLASSLQDKDAKKQEALIKLADPMAELDGDGNVIYKVGGVEQSEDFVREYLKSQYPFLCVGTNAGGGDSDGSDDNTGGAGKIKRSDFDALSPDAKQKAINDKVEIVD